MTKPLPLFAALLLAASGASAQTPAASPLTRIGAAAAVAGRVLATAPSEKVGRVVGSGKPIFLNDHVTTDAAGRLQVLLLDQTVFTLGPNSDMVLDEFVYDPNTNAGKMAASVVKGTFRFVSGHISHENNDNMKIRTPSGTMGIRGTIVVGSVSDQSSTLILAGPGANNNVGETPGRIDVSNGQGSVTIDQPGYGTTVGNNVPPTPPAPMQVQLTQISGQVASNAGGGPGTNKGGTVASGPTGGTTGGPQGPSNPTTASGQDQAQATQSAGVTQTQVDTSQDVSNTTTFASQDVQNVAGVADGITSFDQIFGGITSGVLTGIDRYSMTGSYSCTNGGCGLGVGGTASASIDVDWAGRTMALAGSQLTLNSASSVNGSYGTTFVSLGAVDFSRMPSGPAVFSIPGSGTGSDGGTLSSFTLTLQNAGGVLAKQGAASFNYSGGSGESITGGLTGSRAPSPGN